MRDAADHVLAYPRPADPIALAGRLVRFAEETEQSGLPWAAAHIREVARMVVAEGQLVAAVQD